MAGGALRELAGRQLPWVLLGLALGGGGGGLLGARLVEDSPPAVAAAREQSAEVAAELRAVRQELERLRADVAKLNDSNVTAHQAFGERLARLEARTR